MKDASTDVIKGITTAYKMFMRLKCHPTLHHKFGQTFAEEKIKFRITISKILTPNTELI
jgi:hypothetical protein